MIKNNKVINKILLPKVLLFCSILVFSSATCVYTIKGDVKQNCQLSKSDYGLMFMISLLAIVCCMDVYLDYKKFEKTAISVARNYLKQEQKSNPDLKMFEKVLYNKQAMQNMSTLIFNSLRPSEKKRVVQISWNILHYLKDLQKYDTTTFESLKTTKKLLDDINNQIVPIIQEHASVHPEFVREIFSAMASADMIYIMSKNPIQQHTK